MRGTPGSIEAERKSSGYPEIFGTREVCYSTGGPANHSEQSIYLASVKDAANYTVTSQLYYRSRVMAFGQGFLRSSSTTMGIRCRFRPRLPAVDSKFQSPCKQRPPSSTASED